MNSKRAKDDVHHASIGQYDLQDNLADVFKVSIMGVEALWEMAFPKDQGSY